jgi:predicted HTH domain antitoxin
MTVQIEDDLKDILQANHESPEQAARELIVFELFRRHRISGERAAELLNVSRERFIRQAAAAGIPYLDFDSNELDREIASVMC